MKYQDEYKTFQLSKIEPHQIDALIKIKHYCHDDFSAVILAIGTNENYFTMFIFDIRFITTLINGNIKSISKKDILKFKETGHYIDVINKHFNPFLLTEKIINVDMMD